MRLIVPNILIEARATKDAENQEVMIDPANSEIVEIMPGD